MQEQDSYCTKSSIKKCCYVVALSRRKWRNSDATPLPPPWRRTRTPALFTLLDVDVDVDADVCVVVALDCIVVSGKLCVCVLSATACNKYNAVCNGMVTTACIHMLVDGHSRKLTRSFSKSLNCVDSSDKALSTSSRVRGNTNASHMHVTQKYAYVIYYLVPILQLTHQCQS
jgi:hypothetical protein